MRTNKLTTWAFIVLAIIVASVYIIVNSHTSETETPSVTLPVPSLPVANVVQYYCGDKSLAATYSSGAATLKLSDNRTIEVGQVMSASGVRYENGAIAFITKGNNGYVTENGKTTYENCVAGTRMTGATTFAFKDAGNLFSFTYPNTGSLSGTLGYDINWRQETEKTGLLLAQVIIPKTVQPQTNFSDSKFTIGTSADTEAVETCLTDNMGGKTPGATVVINGMTFTKLTSSDAGAGNLYDTTSYRTVRDGQCYAVEYTIHSTQLGNYPKSAGIKAYDKAAITKMLEDMVQSFKFL